MRHSFKLAASIAFVVFSGAGVAQAVDFAPRVQEFPPREYTCRFDGTNVALGDQRCLKTPQGPRLAECVVVLNMSSWRPGVEACP